MVGPKTGCRLAKRHGDTSLAHFRRMGVQPEQIVGYLAKSCGLRASQAPCTPADLLEDFDLDKLPAHAVRGDDHGLL